MHIKFVKPKSPVAQHAINYVLRLGKKPNPDEKVTVLRGNPQDVARVADSLSYKHKYSSAVIAWHENDKPTDEQVNEVLNDFERLAFAGLDEQQYTFCAVQHAEKDGSKHLHIITPRVDMINDKSMNIAPPNSFKAFDALRDLHNFKHGWKSPDIAAHPENARTLQLGKNRGKRKEWNEAINEFVNAEITTGKIKDRASLVVALQNQGLEITKQSKDFITIKTPEMKKGMRLKGSVYGKDFNISTDAELIRFSREHKARNEANKGKAQENTQSNLREFEARFNRAIQKRIAYNAKRHPSAQLKVDAANGITGSTKAPASGLDGRRLSGELPAHLRAGLADNPSQNGSAAGLPNRARPNQENDGLQPKRMAAGARQYNRSEAEIIAETIAKILEMLAKIFGWDANFTGGNHDRNRGKISELVNSSKRTNQRIVGQQREADNIIFRRTRGLPKRIERAQEMDTRIKRAARANEQRIKQQIEARRHAQMMHRQQQQQQQDQAQDMEMGMQFEPTKDWGKNK